MSEASYVLRRGTVEAAFCDVEALLRGPRTRILNDVRRAAVAVVEGPDGPLVLKRFRDDTPLRLAVALALGPGAERVWRATRLLLDRGFAVPEPVATLERRRFGLPLRSCFVARFVSGPTLGELWHRRRGAARRALTIAFADWLRDLHAAGLYPQDLRAANVLVAAENPAVFVLVDLDRVRRYRRLSWRRRRKNVVQVHRSVGREAPRRESMRFLRRYLGAPSSAELRRIAAEIVALGKRKDAEYARRRQRAAAPAAAGRT
ncbi:MAG: hypothetical protein B6D46_01825 [Polyangiaceae bacterium UTPRO1]|jgi:hypothetical protein|nr:hypothetical protein [Myxococcales bacterium]OQY68861.1 MAG: hypothetical protein B6D46_01825 [Polyangiaceae bacterium UTPRO1]